MENQSPNPTQESLGTLSTKEVELIYWIRNRFKYGSLSIETRDGQPYRISKMTEFQTLD
jgi:hypothetical protein